MSVTLRLNVVVLAVLFTAEVALISEMRDVILQVPVSLLKVSVRMVLKSMNKFTSLFHLIGVVVLVGGLLNRRTVGHEVSVLSSSVLINVTVLVGAAVMLLIDVTILVGVAVMLLVNVTILV